MKTAPKFTPHIDGELSVREIQLESLNILKVVDSICKQENICYWLMYGSLLGAVRHKGFIPWDDDLDIAMPRPDYDRFLAYFDSNKANYLPLIALRGDGDTKLPFMITRISDTKYRMVGEYGDEVPELGAFIDVYPMDGSGESIEGSLELKTRCLKEVRTFQNAANSPSSNVDCGFVRKQLRKIRAALLGNPDRWVNKLAKLATRYDYDTSKYISCLMWPFDTGRPYVGERELFQTKLCKFEDIEVPIPVGYEKVLTELYGDYMQLPPKEKRVGHHYYSLVKRS